MKCRLLVTSQGIPSSLNLCGFKFPSRINSTGSNVLMYIAASLLETVVRNNSGSVKRTLPALEIKC